MEVNHKKVNAMNGHLFTWVAGVLLLVSAAMLVAGVGAAGLWISVITIGIALVVIDGRRSRVGRRQG
jgi:hypothetical protein